MGPSRYAHRDSSCDRLVVSRFARNVNRRSCINWQRLKLQSSLSWSREGAKKRINAAKRSAVSTGQLSVLPHVHLRPIDLVVFQEPSSLRTGDLVLQGVSRLDAFSVYPGRT